MHEPTGGDHPARLEPVAPQTGRIYNPSNRAQALGYLQARQARGQVVTGLLYVDPTAGDLHDVVNTIDTPLNELNEAELVPGSDALAKINAALR